VPFTYAIDRDRWLVTVTVAGPWHLACALASMRAVRADPRLRPADRVLVDLRAADYAPIRAEVRALAAVQALPAGYLGHRVAVLAARPPLAKALALRARLCRSRGAACRAFRSPDPALAWLDAPWRPTGFRRAWGD
jgi:hypothetical protein